MKKTIFLMVLLMSALHVTAQEATYRPIVEEGKVWKVGWIPSGSEYGNVAQVIAYFWLDDNVDAETRAYVDNITEWHCCLKLMREYVCNEEYKDLFPEGPQDCNYLIEDTCSRFVYDGYVTKNPDSDMCYWRGQILYIFDKDVIYDYSINNRVYHSSIRDVSRGTYENGFKGLISTVLSSNAWYTEYYVFDEDVPEPYYEFETKWLEGVGSVYGPYPSIIDPKKNAIEWYLMECRVGDDVLYHNPDIIDGVNPPDEETKKRIDFTHIEKPQPTKDRKAPKESVSLNGEFSARLLDLQLGNMSDTYDVTITDDAGEVVYQKTVRTADVLALNIDVSEWAAPSYTINVENDYEQYVGNFELTPTGIEEVKSEELKVKNDAMYDLTGRRVTTPTKGLYIINGKKVVMR